MATSSSPPGDGSTLAAPGDHQATAPPATTGSSRENEQRPKIFELPPPSTATEEPTSTTAEEDDGNGYTKSTKQGDKSSEVDFKRVDPEKEAIDLPPDEEAVAVLNNRFFGSTTPVVGTPGAASGARSLLMSPGKTKGGGLPRGEDAGKKEQEKTTTSTSASASTSAAGSSSSEAEGDGVVGGALVDTAGSSSSSSSTETQASSSRNKQPSHLSWDEYFMYIALLSSFRAKDPSTQVGCCIINRKKRVIGMGYNGFPRIGSSWKPSVFVRPALFCLEKFLIPVCRWAVDIALEEKNGSSNSLEDHDVGGKAATSLAPSCACSSLACSNAKQCMMGLLYPGPAEKDEEEIVVICQPAGASSGSAPPPPVSTASSSTAPPAGEEDTNNKLNENEDEQELQKASTSSVSTFFSDKISFLTKPKPKGVVAFPPAGETKSVSTDSLLDEATSKGGSRIASSPKTPGGAVAASPTSEASCDDLLGSAADASPSAKGGSGSKKKKRPPKKARKREANKMMKQVSEEVIFAEVEENMRPMSGEEVEGREQGGAGKDSKIPPAGAVENTEKIDLDSPAFGLSAASSSSSSGATSSFKTSRSPCLALKTAFSSCWPPPTLRQVVRSMLRPVFRPGRKITLRILRSLFAVPDSPFLASPTFLQYLRYLGLWDNDVCFPWGRDDSEGVSQSKYAYVVHAEANAILNKTAPIDDECVMYTSLYPCNECAKLVVQTGIKEVVYLSDKHHHTESAQAARRIFHLAGVNAREFIPRGYDTKKNTSPALDEVKATVLGIESAAESLGLSAFSDSPSSDMLLKDQPSYLTVFTWFLTWFGCGLAFGVYNGAGGSCTNLMPRTWGDLRKKVSEQAGRAAAGAASLSWGSVLGSGRGLVGGLLRSFSTAAEGAGSLALAGGGAGGAAAVVGGRGAAGGGL